jgi:hypothetical protein
MDGFPICLWRLQLTYTLPLTNIPYPKVCLSLVCQGFAWQQFLLCFYATLLDSSECHLHYCDYRHSLNVIYLLLDTLQT